MEAALPLRPSATRERNPSALSTAARSSVFSERTSIRNAASTTTTENQSPSELPKTFYGMLRIKTDTGDIGMFSIKPSRISQALSSLRGNGTSYLENAQRPRQQLQPYGMPATDDRRRLPSYARDTTLEVIAMSEISGQRACSRPPQHSEHRSCFNLGGLVDYSRHAEIEHPLQVASRSTLSPGSLYAHKRRPPGPLSIRSKANRSTPSLSSQHSPPRRSPSPHFQQSAAAQMADWKRKGDSLLENTSPTRSTYSQASTVNLLGTLAPATTTPGKLCPHSPLYYDYTEDFDVDQYKQPVAHPPPPAFHLGELISEDDTADIGTQYLQIFEARLLAVNTRPPLCTSHSATSIINGATGTFVESSRELLDEEGAIDVNSVGCRRDTKFVRRSGLGYSAQELSTNIEEVFGLLSSPSFDVPLAAAREQITVLDGVSDAADQLLVSESQSHPSNSVQSTLYGLETNLGKISYPRGCGILGSQGEGANDSANEVEENIFSQQSWPPRSIQDPLVLPDGLSHKVFGNYKVAESDSIHLGISLLNKPNKVSDQDDNGFQGEMQSPFRSPDTSRQVKTELEGLSVGDICFLQQPLGEPRPPLEKVNTPATAHGGSYQPTDPIHCGRPGATPSSTSNQIVLADLPNFSHQMSSTIISHPESPIIIPKPMSSARQLKLKNGVPQLMKALPPLPSEPADRQYAPGIDLDGLGPSSPTWPPLELPELGSSRLCESIETSLPSPSIRNGRAGLPRFLTKSEAGPQNKRLLIRAAEGEITFSSLDNASPFAFLPRLKLKTRGSKNMPVSRLDAQPRNLNEIYPWPGEDLGATPNFTVDEHIPGSLLPKFKLRVTRVSNSSQGTMVISRESTDLRSPVGLHFQSPKDLFTPRPGLDNIYRQVGRHIVTKTTGSSIHEPSTINSSSLSTSLPSQITFNRSKLEDAKAPEFEQKPFMLSTPRGTQSSFSDNSSRITGNSGLRKRLFNLKARIPFQYSCRGVQSFNNVTWEQGSGENLQTPNTLRSTPILHSNLITVSQVPHHHGSQTKHGLRIKPREWFRRARLAFRSHRPRVRGLTGRGRDDERLRLTNII